MLSNFIAVSMPVRPTNRLCQAVDMVRRLMNDNDFGLCNGAVYKKIKDSKYTYVFCCQVSRFLKRILRNGEVANQLAMNLYEVDKLLSDPDCEIIPQMKIDFNYIECLNGMCFNIMEKKFVDEPQLKGTPRAYVKYKFDKDKKPYPKPFVEGKNIIFPNGQQRIVTHCNLL